MTKKQGKTDDVIDEIRFLYIQNNVPIAELAETYKINIQTLHSRKRRENWNLLRETNNDDLFLSRTCDIYQFKGESIEFWNVMLDKTKKLSKKNLSPKSLEQLANVRIKAEERKAMFTKIELMEKRKDDKEGSLGILDEINGLGGE